MGVLGLSVQLAALNDALFFCSFWLIGMYSVFALLYRFMLSFLGTLGKLFRGLKFNILRVHFDSAKSSISELNLGVLLGSLTIFLLPTVAFFYYYCFIVIIISVLSFQLLLISA